MPDLPKIPGVKYSTDGNGDQFEGLTAKIKVPCDTGEGFELLELPIIMNPYLLSPHPGYDPWFLNDTDDD